MFNRIKGIAKMVSGCFAAFLLFFLATMNTIDYPYWLNTATGAMIIFVLATNTAMLVKHIAAGIYKKIEEVKTKREYWIEVGR